MKGTQVLKHLRDHGCVFVRERQRAPGMRGDQEVMGA